MLKWKAGQPNADGDVLYATGGDTERPNRFTVSKLHIGRRAVVNLYDGCAFVGQFNSSDEARKKAEEVGLQ